MCQCEGQSFSDMNSIKIGSGHFPDFAFHIWRIHRRFSRSDVFITTGNFLQHSNDGWRLSRASGDRKSPRASTLLSKWSQILSSFQVDIFVGVFYVLWYSYYSSFTPTRLLGIFLLYFPAVFSHKLTRSREYPEWLTRTFALSHPCPSGILLILQCMFESSLF